MEIKQIAIIGAGTMGNGIAQVCATYGLQITLVDIAEEQLEKGRSTIEKSLRRLVSKDKMVATNAFKYRTIFFSIISVTVWTVHNVALFFAYFLS